MTLTQAYIYRWVHLPTGKWYIGSRTKKGCYPGDNYICSSKLVKPLIVENKNEWQQEVLAIGDPLYIRELEAAYLRLVDARNDKSSYNLHNGDGKFTTAGIKLSKATCDKMKQAKIGKCIGELNGFYGKKHKAESIEKSKRYGSANGMYGRTGKNHPGSCPKTESFKELMKIRMTGEQHPAKDPKNRVVCEYCGLKAQKTNYKRWHGVNCKQRKNHEST